MNEYKYIRFVKTEPKKPRKTSIWSCRNKSAEFELGIIEWYRGWRQYCYFPSITGVYSAGCLDDISDFIKKQMAKRKEP